MTKEDLQQTIEIAKQDQADLYTKAEAFEPIIAALEEELKKFN